MKKQIFAGILTSAMVLSMVTLSNASTRLEISQQTTDGLDAGSHTINATFTPTVTKNNYEELYEEQLKKIRNFDSDVDYYLDDNWDNDAITLNSLIVNNKFDQLGYELLDVNDDGIPELFLGLIGEKGSYLTYSIVDNTVFPIAYTMNHYGASLTSSMTFYEWDTDLGRIHAIFNESVYNNSNLQDDNSIMPLEPIKLCHSLYHEFMDSSQYGYYTASSADAMFSAVFENESLETLTPLSEDEVSEFFSRMDDGYSFNYIPLEQPLQAEVQSDSPPIEDSTVSTQEIGLLFDVTYLSDPYPSYVTFYQDGTYNLQANLGVGYGTDIGTYTIENNQILCTIQDRQWSGFTWDDVNTYSFFVTDGKLTFQLEDDYYKKDAFGNTYTLDNFCYMNNGDVLTVIPSLPIATLYTTYHAETSNIDESSFILWGTLPKGLGIYDDGIIGGIPTQEGTFNFLIKSSTGKMVSYSITVQGATSENVEADNDFEIIERIPTIDSNESDHIFEISGEYSNFLQVYLDGDLLIRDVDYTAEEGSTKITIAAQTFAQLDEGSHTINATFAPTSATVNPSTGTTSSNSASSNATVQKVAQTFMKTVPASTTIAAMPFTDVAVSDWHYQYVRYMYDTGTFSGVTATTYEPNSGMTRAMMAVVFYGMADKPSTNSANFSDVADGEWYADAVNWISTSGIDDSVGTFRPTDLITREETAKMMHNFCTDQGIFIPLNTSRTPNDIDSVSENAQTAVTILFSKGIFAGDSGNNFNPHNTSTRAEISAMMRTFMWATV